MKLTPNVINRQALRIQAILLDVHNHNYDFSIGSTNVMFFIGDKTVYVPFRYIELYSCTSISLSIFFATDNEIL